MFMSLAHCSITVCVYHCITIHSFRTASTTTPLPSRKKHVTIDENVINSSRSPAAWDIPKSPLDDIFRANIYGNLNDVEAVNNEEIYDDEDTDSGDDDDDDDDDETPSTVPTEDAVVPAWDLPKSPYDDVFRKRVGKSGIYSSFSNILIMNRVL